MPIRIGGVTLPQDKRIVISLTYIYGIGNTTAKKILASVKINPNTRVKDLTDADEAKIREFIKTNYKIEGDLKRDVMGNIKRLREIKCYRGIRHAKNLPCRGQRTKTNSRTVRGNVRKTLMSGRKISAQKT
ncbi:MAG: 30S ribosomal protein S13 [Candidatus Parcubacteria bacterium]|nr:30S ribosomal protein S13 [Candidatus Parcubacteria bacterium]